MKMFVSDLDGTVLMHGETQVKKDLLKMIEELYAEKKDFVVASGRSYGALKRFFPNQLLSMHFICENGALVQYQGKTMFKKALGKREALTIISEIEDCGCEWVAAGVHTVYTGNQCAKVSGLYHEMKTPIMKVLAAREIPEDVLRISVFHEGSEERERVTEIINKANCGMKISYQDNTWTDVIDESINKGVALENLMKLRGIEKEEVAVFGDNTNDIEMFQVTPNSYAMSWAIPNVKKAAQSETDCVLKSIRGYMEE